MGDFDSLIFFLSVGVLSTFFSKNMTVNLIVAIASTNILFAGERIREGLKNKKKIKKKEKRRRTTTTMMTTKPKKKKITIQKADETEEDEPSTRMRNLHKKIFLVVVRLQLQKGRKMKPLGNVSIMHLH